MKYIGILPVILFMAFLAIAGVVGFWQSYKKKQYSGFMSFLGAVAILVSTTLISLWFIINFGVQEPQPEPVTHPYRVYDEYDLIFVNGPKGELFDMREQPGEEWDTVNITIFGGDPDNPYQRVYMRARRVGIVKLPGIDP